MGPASGTLPSKSKGSSLMELMIGQLSEFMPMLANAGGVCSV